MKEGYEGGNTRPRLRNGFGRGVCACARGCVDSSPPGSSGHGDSPGKNTGVGCHSLLQGITREANSPQCLPSMAGHGDDSFAHRPERTQSPL